MGAWNSTPLRRRPEPGGPELAPEAEAERAVGSNHPAPSAQESTDSQESQQPASSHWCHQCQRRVAIQSGECIVCHGGFVEIISIDPELVDRNRLVSALAVHFMDRVAVAAGTTTEEARRGLQDGRIEDLLRDLQTHLRLVGGIRTAMLQISETHNAAKFDPAGPEVWNAIRTISGEELERFLARTEDQCVICCADYVEGLFSNVDTNATEADADKQPSHLFELPRCKHVFHEECLREWLNRASNCPICRNDLKEAATSAEENEASKEEECA